MEVEADATNIPIWARDVALFAIEGWLDPGELRATLYAADLARGEPILDLGVGAGRTVSLLRLISADYRAVDYVPEMVEACRARHPGIRVSQGDARDLRDIADGSCGLVTFSSNGIDAVDHSGRDAILSSVHRVLRTAGIFFFSTLKQGTACCSEPGRERRLSSSGFRFVAAGRRLGWPSRRRPALGPAVVNWRSLRKATEDHGDWGMAPFAAHEFGLLTHFVTVKGVREELDAHGFETLEIFACEDGSVICDRTSETMYMHVVARRR